VSRLLIFSCDPDGRISHVKTASPPGSGRPMAPTLLASDGLPRHHCFCDLVTSIAIGVLFIPGHSRSALTRIPRVAYSSAADRVRPMTACLLAE
jgi:hypothetical protein